MYEDMSDEEILTTYLGYKYYLIDRGYNISSQEFISGMRNGQYNIKEYETFNNTFENKINSIKIQKSESIPYNTNAIVCPYCGSYLTEKISTTSRLVSTAFLGFGSGKIGKQWHCTRCKSNF